MTTTPLPVTQKLLEASIALRDDMLRRAEMNKWQNDGELVVEAGAGAWSRFCRAIDTRASQPATDAREAEIDKAGAAERARCFEIVDGWPAHAIGNSTLAAIAAMFDQDECICPKCGIRHGGRKSNDASF